MTGYAYLRKSVLQEANRFDFSPAGAGHYPGSAAEVLSLRCMYNLNETVHAVPLNDDSELALMSLVKNGDFDARQKLITRNLCEVLRSYRRYADKGVGIIELIKAGNRGLAQALEDFERKGNGSFSTYAGCCIREHIERAILVDDGRRPAIPKESSRGHQRIAAGCAARLHSQIS